MEAIPVKASGIKREIKMNQCVRCGGRLFYEWDLTTTY